MAVRDDIIAFKAYYEKCKARLEGVLLEFNRELMDDGDPIRRTLLTDMADLGEGGKLLRGMLVSLGYAIGGGADESYSDALALSYEIFQTAILIHDDIIDNAKLRRGKVTIHERLKSRFAGRADDADVTDAAKGAALCVGDYGLYMANMKIAQAYAADPHLGELLRYFDGTVLRTIRGELLDVMLPWEMLDSLMEEDEKKELLQKSVWDIYHLKTACYSVIGPLHLGMILAGAPREQMEAMDRFAAETGTAYQIMDDILGIYADAGHIGKDVGVDIAEFKQTILWMYVRVNCPDAARELLKYYGKKDVTEESLREVRRIFTDSGALAYAHNALEERIYTAEAALDDMEFLSPDTRNVLRGFAQWCAGRSR
ncbi:MAG: polyprenyl synthetase family protein [Lachnospiraceae bacterium]|nr:polyprenyl synthetase family protein [Lachnospiraceae bacterium]